MKCPVCKTIELQKNQLDSGLKTYNCGRCNGNWIRYNDYDQWKEELAEGEENVELQEEYQPIYDSKKAGLCPECGRILIKYKVAPELAFRVDHCGSCNGVWLDKNEWESLSQKGLHDDMNKFFTEPWQRKLKEEMTKQRIEEHYSKKFGEEVYKHLKETKEWIEKSDFRNELLAFLMDDDPYKL